MPIVPGFLERLFMLRLNKGPAPFLDVMGGISFWAVHAAVQLDLFERLAGAPGTAEELAARLDYDPRGLHILLELLETLGYVRQKDDAYALTAMSEAWMLESSPANFSLAFRYYGNSMPAFWPRLADAVRSGAPQGNFYDWLADHPEDGERYQRFMMSLARMGMDEWKKKVRLPDGARTAIDVGGGHGLYAIALCEKYPDLTATVFDSAYARDTAEANIEAAGLGDRVAFVEGDYMTDDLGDGFDAALLSNVVHQQTDEQNRALVARIAGALGPGGCLIIADTLREKKLTALMDHIARAFSLIFYLFLHSQNFSFEEMGVWLRSAGFETITRHTLRAGPDLVIGHRL